MKDTTAKPGRADRYLEIDLTSREVRKYRVPSRWLEQLIGGKGIGGRIVLEGTERGVDATGPSNILVVNTGPFTGSGAPCSSRFNISAKSPLTGAMASSSCGGNFGPELRRAGIDGLVIKGRADSPIYLEIEEGSVAFRDASGLWGLDTAETQARMPGKAKAVIGPAGENGVLFASVISAERAAGRCGVGAVMGSKNLKGICVTGKGRPRAADPEKFSDGVKRATAMLKSHTVTGTEGTLRKLGTAMLVQITDATGTLPTRNFARGTFERAEAVSGETLVDTIKVGNTGCPACPIRCGNEVLHRGSKVKGPEFETLALLGPNLEVSDLEAIVEWNRICDLMGMDTISAGGTLGFAMELAERGLIDCDLRFGDTRGVSEALMDTALRRDLGAELALGTRLLAERHGGADYAPHARGLELPGYEPRGAVGHGLGYALANRGGCHINGGGLVYLEALTSLAIDPLKTHSKPELVAFAQAVSDSWSTLGLCFFLAFGMLPQNLRPMSAPVRIAGRLALLSGPALRVAMRHPRVLDAVPVPFKMLPYLHLLKWLTGMKIGLGSFLEVGLRVNTQERLFNVREGQGSSEDRLSRRLTSEPQTDDPRSCVPLEAMLPAAYRAKGWDPTGRPTAATLKRLSLEGLA